MGSAPLTQSLIDQVRAAFPKAAISNGYGTTEAGPVVFGPHPKGIPQPELSTGCAASAVSSCAWCATARKSPTKACSR